MDGDINGAETTDVIVKIVQILAKTAPRSTHSALQQYLASSGQCITTPPATHPTDSATKGRLVPVIVSFRSHNLGHSDPKKDLDREIQKLRDFFRRHLHLDTVHILLETSVWSGFWITYDSDMKLQDISSHDTILLVYSGHGHRDKTTGIWYMDNGKSASYKFHALFDHIEQITAVRTYLIVLDACESGSAAPYLKSRARDSKQKLQGNVAIISASTWDSLTPAHGDDTLTKRLAGAISEALLANEPIKAIGLYKAIQKVAIDSGVGLPMLDFAGSVVQDIVLHTGVKNAFRRLQFWAVRGWVFKTLPWLKVRPDLGSLIGIVGDDFTSPSSASTQYVDWVPWYKEMSVEDLTRDWARQFQLPSGSTIHLRYFDRFLEASADLITTLRDIKTQQSGLEPSHEHVFILAASIEDKRNPFGAKFEGNPIQTDYVTFGQYMHRHPFALAPLENEKLTDESKRKAFQAFIAHYEMTHAREEHDLYPVVAKKV